MEDEKSEQEEFGINIIYENIENDSIRYAGEKLGIAAWKLATGTEGIKTRLADTFIEIAILKETDFPIELRDLWRQIYLDLTCGKMQFETRIENGKMIKVPVGRLYSTLRYMRKDKAQKIAQQILDLEAKLNNYIESMNDSG
jgi:hypothetical protein